MIILKKNIMWHIFFILWWSIRSGIRFKTSFYLNFFIFTTIRQILICSSSELLLFSLSDHPRWLLDFFSVTKVSFLQLGTLDLHMSRFMTFKADDLVAFFLVLLLECYVLSSRGMLELSYIFHHLLELFGHKIYFLIRGISKTIVWAIRLNHFHFKSFRETLLFFSSGSSLSRLEGNISVLW